MLPMIQAPMDPGASQLITRALEMKDVPFDELISASELLTAAMGRLMALREKINGRIRDFGKAR